MRMNDNFCSLHTCRYKNGRGDEEYRDSYTPNARRGGGGGNRYDDDPESGLGLLDTVQTHNAM